jgi:hypothetical protein
VTAPTVGPLVLACGALAAELRATLARLDLVDVQVQYLPANLHNRPEKIAPAIATALAAAGDRQVFVAYADCGTGGALDRVLDDHPGVERLPGAHCYEVFAGADAFAALQDEELGTLYLTDFLAKHFDALVWQGLGLDRYPQLRDTYFGHYRRVVLLSQTDEPGIVEAARVAADRLGLTFDHRPTGLGRLVDAVSVSLRPAERVG